MRTTQWYGKKVAFLGDSITDKCHVGTTQNYWHFLRDYLGIEHLVYGINGWSWAGLVKQAEALKQDHGTDLDAILVFMGTNDYNSNVPLGEWFTTHEEEVNSHGTVMKKQRREFCMDPATFRGRINIGLKYLKENFPLQQIILLTPVHRGYANFGGANVQPEETFPNDINVYVDDYISALREAGSLWSVPVIDLFAVSGLFPVNDAYAQFFHDADTDRLHPNAAGHDRIAKTLMYQLLSLPSTFR